MPAPRPIKVGEKFTRWTVVSDAGREPRGGALYLCRCKCGTEKVCSMGSLRSGSTKSCGCLMREAVSRCHGKPVAKGERFNRWTALAKSRRTTGDNPRSVVKCRCDCGTVRVVGVSSLRSGKSSSCGCRNIEVRSAPMSAGEKFGRLTVVGFAFRKAKKSGSPGEAFYKFTCDCGSPVTARMSHVRNGNIKSCGCLNRESSSETGSRMVRGGLYATKRFVYRSGARTVNMRSSWEVAVAHYLDSCGKTWEYEPRSFTLAPSVRYTPDFYVPDDDAWIEVKGFQHKCFAEKRRLFEKDHSLIVVDAATLTQWTGLTRSAAHRKYPPMVKSTRKSELI